MKLLVAAAFVYLSSFLNVPSMTQRENSEYWISVIEIILIHSTNNSTYQYGYEHILSYCPNQFLCQEWKRLSLKIEKVEFLKTKGIWKIVNNHEWEH